MYVLGVAQYRIEGTNSLDKWFNELATCDTSIEIQTSLIAVSSYRLES